MGNAVSAAEVVSNELLHKGSGDSGNSIKSPHPSSWTGEPPPGCPMHKSEGASKVSLKILDPSFVKDEVIAWFSYCC